MRSVTISAVIVFCAGAVIALCAARLIPIEPPTDEELALHRMINEYRATKKLPAIKLSKSLTFIARTHVRDMSANPASGSCNLHSWSSKGEWTGCCYTGNHAKAQCMWDKPRELSNYPGNGYECAHMFSAGATAKSALSGWKGSPGHNAVITSSGIWSSHPWKSIGVGIYENYAVIWFGEEEDPDGYWE
jgi:uncharacterized protein YkwD